MIYVHESNLLSKINDDYKEKGKEIKEFYQNVYLKYRKKLESLDYSSENIEIYNLAATLIDEYLIEVEDFSNKNKISSQSKFRSTFIEEISAILFADVEQIRNGTFGIYNKDVFSGLKVNNQIHIDIIKKDVDFCIGRKVKLNIDDIQLLEVIIPVICVEVKTYLDATMFNEVQFSSIQIKNASPNARTYVLMEYNTVADEKVISARYANNLNEMFVLRNGDRKEGIEKAPMDGATLLDYYKEIKKEIERTTIPDDVIVPGRLLKKETD